MHRAIAATVLGIFAVMVVVLLLRWHARPATAATTVTSGSQAQALQALDESSSDLLKLEGIQQKMMRINAQQATLYAQLNDKVSAWSKQIAKLSDSSSQLMQATKNMQETQMSFNLQYLQLQNDMQNENRQFTMVSNIMKTKHDTVKNSISNIR